MISLFAHVMDSFLNPPTAAGSRELVERIKAKARELGFDRVGIAPAGRSQRAEYFRRWLDDGQAGSMHWLTRRFEERIDPAVYFPGAASVVCVAVNYHVPLPEPVAHEETAPVRVARYALGDDYHQWVKSRLHVLADWMRQIGAGETRCAVDTAPVMEKELAARAGIGWLGKNSCIIDEAIGSWLLLGEVLTSLPLPADEPAVDRCGSCTRCIDACPTGAITGPYQLDARRCISYLTIEHRGDIAAEFQRQMGDWAFGCDICQEVCPFNRKAAVATEPAVQPRFPSGTIDAGQVANWSVEEFRDRFRNSAVRRVSLPILQRNAAIAAQNRPTTQ
jgi:epoxyqueuosine reductase